MDSIFLSDAAVKNAITENLRPLRAESEAITGRIDEAFADFDLNTTLPEEDAHSKKAKNAGRPQEDPGRRTYVKHGADVSETLERVILEGVDALKSSETPRSITFSDRAILENLNGDGSSSVELKKVIEVIDEKSRGSTLLKTLATAKCTAKDRAEEIVTDIKTADETKAAEANGKKPAVNLGADQLVKGSVNLQMNSATSPEATLAYGSMPKIPNTADKDETQKRILDTFQLRPGPSDVTSYHDFHTLQIAFQHVWTRIFDGELELLGRELYREYVKLKNFGGFSEADLKVRTAKDLRRLIDEVHKLSQWVEDDMPRELRGGEDDGRRGSKDPNDFEKAVETGLDIATLGATWLLRQLVEEFSKIGRKPIIKWEEFPGPWGGRQDRIERGRVDGIAPAGNVEISLMTARNSRVKIVELQLLDQGSKQLVRGSRLDNREGRLVGDTLSVSMVVPSAWMATSVLVFSSEESSQADIRDRYVLADLSRYVVERSRVTLTWKDS